MFNEERGCSYNFASMFKFSDTIELLMFIATKIEGFPKHTKQNGYTVQGLVAKVKDTVADG